MPVNNKHNDYVKRVNQWSKCRDAISGSDAIKKSATKYLPKLSGQNQDEYNAYKQRALYYNASSRTVQGLMGAIFRKPYNLEFPERFKEQLESITLDGISLESFVRDVVSQTLVTGRLGIINDVISSGSETRNYLALYKADSVINWREIMIGSQRVVSLVVLSESYEEVADDGFTVDVKEQFRVLQLGRMDKDSGITYIQDVYRLDKHTAKYLPVAEMHIEPTKSGVAITEIPFVFMNRYDLGTETDNPPLVDLVEVNISHYRTSADLEHGAHFTALPTAWVAGFSSDSELRIGSGTAWVSEDTDAKVGFLEYTGQGLGALQSLKKDKENLMAVLGARLLEEQKKAAEAADTLRIRSAGESGSLTAITKNISEGIEKALKTYAWWLGASDKEVDDIVFELNTDFIDSKMTPQEISELMKMYQGGGISQDTFLFNLKRGEVLPNDRDIEEEKELIDLQGGGIEDDLSNIIPIKRNFDIETDNNGRPKSFKEV